MSNEPRVITEEDLQQAIDKAIAACMSKITNIDAGRVKIKIQRILSHHNNPDKIAAYNRLLYNFQMADGTPVGHDDDFILCQPTLDFIKQNDQPILLSDIDYMNLLLEKLWREGLGRFQSYLRQGMEFQARARAQQIDEEQKAAAASTSSDPQPSTQPPESH